MRRRKERGMCREEKRWKVRRKMKKGRRTRTKVCCLSLETCKGP
jgi:hypothetical protein